MTRPSWVAPRAWLGFIELDKAVIQRPGSGAGGATPRPRSGATVWRRHPTYEARDGSQEEQPHAGGQRQRLGRSTHLQGAVAALAQEGLEELSYVEGQEGQR